MALQNVSPSSLQEMLGRMLDTGLFSDLVLVVGIEKHCFNVHKMILGGRSEVFRTMLQKRWMNDGKDNQSQEEDVINLPSHSVDAFQSFLRFLYTDETTCPKNVDDALEVLELSHLYGILGILNSIKVLLQQWINAETCLKIYARSRMIDQDLSQQSFQFFVKNIRSAAENDQYLGWDAETVRTLLSQESLDIREIHLFKALLKWGNHSDDHHNDVEFPRSHAMPELMKMIRFPSMGRQTFASEVVPTGVFPNEEVEQMFQHFDNPKQVTTPFNNTLRFRSNKLTLIPAEFLVYPNSTSGDHHVSLHSITYNELAELRPEIRLQISKSIHLHGIGILHSDIQKSVRDTLKLDFEVIIKNEEGIVVAEKKDRISRLEGLSGITLDKPILLRRNKAYDFMCICKSDANYGMGYSQWWHMDQVNLYCRGQDNAEVNSMRSIDLGNGVVGTINYHPQNRSHLTNSVTQFRTRSSVMGAVQRSKWIRHLVLSSSDPEEFVPCNIT